MITAWSMTVMPEMGLPHWSFSRVSLTPPAFSAICATKLPKKPLSSFFLVAGRGDPPNANQHSHAASWLSAGPAADETRDELLPSQELPRRAVD